MEAEEIRNHRLKAGALHIQTMVKSYDIDDLVFNMYLPIKDEDTKKLVAFYEEQLILAKTLDIKEFAKIRPKKNKEVCNWIKKHKKWRLFADFLMYVERNMENRPLDILTAYMSALMDTWANLPPFTYYWYGMDGDKPLFMKELYGAYDVKTYEAMAKMDKTKDPTKLALLFEEQMKYQVEIEEIVMNEKNISNLIFTMIGIINPENQDFIFPFREWSNHVILSLDFPRQVYDNNFYLDMLDKRNYLLASEGVKVKCFNAYHNYKEIRLKEEFLEDGMLLLFRVTNHENKHTMGFVDLRNKYIYGLGKHSSNEKFFNDFINFILEVYCSMTCEFESKLIQLYDLEKIDSITEPAIYVEIHETEGSTGISRQATQKAFHHVKPFLRKGNASEQQKAKARMLGILVPQGYTFVSEHERGRKGVM